MESTRLGSLTVSRFILGSNPISGFSHQTPEADSRMRHYFTSAQTKRLFADAEAFGVTALIARGDHHIMRLLMEYWDQGGKLNWIAQTCPELGTIERGVQNAIKGGASAAFVHGGVMDNLFAHGKLEEVPVAIDMIRSAGMPAGIAGHNPEVFRWAEQNIDVDFYMCSHYNPSSRAQSAEHQSGVRECFLDEDRQAMVDTIAELSRPAIHYKVLAAGRNDPEPALAFVKAHLRPADAVCIGVYDENNPHIIRQNLELLGVR